MRYRALIIAAGLLGLAVALVWFRREQPQDAVSEAVSLPPAVLEPVAVSDDPPASDEVRARFPPAPQERVADGATRAAPEPPRSPLPGEALTTPLTQLLEDQRAFRRAQPTENQQEFPPFQPRIAESERAFAAEPVDTAWAAGAETNVLGTIAQINGLELLDLRVECRSTLCRLQMAQPGGPGTVPFHDVIDAIDLEPHWVISLAGRGGGSLNTVAYLWREGFAPPRPGAPEEPSDGDETRLSEPAP